MLTNLYKNFVLELEWICAHIQCWCSFTSPMMRILITADVVYPYHCWYVTTSLLMCFYITFDVKPYHFWIVFPSQIKCVPFSIGHHMMHEIIVVVLLSKILFQLNIYIHSITVSVRFDCTSLVFKWNMYITYHLFHNFRSSFTALAHTNWDFETIYSGP